MDTTLTRALDLLAGAHPPCVDDPGRWYSTNPVERAHAAADCRRCPLRDPCRALGQNEPFGVWGGEDRTPSTPTPPAPRPRRRARRRPRTPNTPDGQPEQDSPPAEAAARPDRPEPHPPTPYGP